MQKVPATRKEARAGVLPIDDADAPLYTIGQVAGMLDARMSFLRRLDEQGVVVPARSAGGQRRYSRREIGQIAEAMTLIQEGLTLAGIRRVLDLRAHIRGLEAELAARDTAGGDTAGRGTAGRDMAARDTAGRDRAGRDRTPGRSSTDGPPPDGPSTSR